MPWNGVTVTFAVVGPATVSSVLSVLSVSTDPLIAATWYTPELPPAPLTLIRSPTCNPTVPIQPAPAASVIESGAEPFVANVTVPVNTYPGRRSKSLGSTGANGSPSVFVRTIMLEPEVTMLPPVLRMRVSPIGFSIPAAPGNSSGTMTPRPTPCRMMFDELRFLMSSSAGSAM